MSPCAAILSHQCTTVASRRECLRLAYGDLKSGACGSPRECRRIEGDVREFKVDDERFE